MIRSGRFTIVDLSQGRYAGVSVYSCTYPSVYIHRVYLNFDEHPLHPYLSARPKSAVRFLIVLVIIDRHLTTKGNRSVGLFTLELV